MSNNTPLIIRVLVATYCRNESLAILLQSLDRQHLEGYQLEATVVDNNLDGRAIKIVSKYASWCSYVHCPSGGLSAVRNEGLRSVKASDFCFLFIDDDEFPSTDWAARMISMAVKHHAPMVSGPVVPIYATKFPSWARRLGFFEPSSYGREAHKLPSTNNSLVTMEAYVRAGAPKFDSCFDTTGGEDTDFFLRIAAAAGEAVSAPNAVTYERVARERARASWLWRRGMQLGAVNARTRFAHLPRPVVFLVGFMRAVVTPIFVARALFAGLQFVGPAMMSFPKGVGLAGASLGYYVRPYSKSQRLEQ